MYISPYYVYAGATMVIGIFSRIWVTFRRDRAARRAMKTPLFDQSQLDAALTPTEGMDDDPAILAELGETLSHLNRQAFAEELWNLEKSLTKYYRKIPAAKRPTMQRALIRLIESDDKWLQIVGAKTCASLKIAEATEPLTRLVDRNAGDERFRTELDTCLRKLTAG
jgi:hypothetical protein